MNKTLLLDGNWDIGLDGSNNLAWTSGKYAVAQNVACACRAFTEDMYFNPYHMEGEALKFPEVNSAKLGDLSFENRVMHGNLQLTR